jgi:hypothetical protein
MGTIKFGIAITLAVDALERCEPEDVVDSARTAVAEAFGPSSVSWSTFVPSSLARARLVGESSTNNE